MKNNISTAIAITACLLTVICLLHIYDLRQQILNSENNLRNYLYNVESSIDSIYYNIDTMLFEQATLLADSNWNYGEADIDAKSATIQCSVAPKEYRPDTTTAILICNDTEYPMALKNGEYTLALPLALFDESIISKVLFIDNGTVRTEALDWYITPRYEFLPI